MEKRDETVFISDSIIPESARLYFRAEVRGAEIKEMCVVGDNSRVRESLLGEYVSTDRNNLIMGSRVGRYTYTGPFDMIFNAEIGSFCSISYGVTIGPPEHDYERISTHPFLHNGRYGILDENDLLEVSKFNKSCTIGHDVWIGCNATILRGVTVGCGAVIGANALVNKDIPPYAIVGGVPARIIKYRFEKEIIEKLMTLEWWNWNVEKIRKNRHIFTNKVKLENLKNII